jgi:hypothetical protein
LGRMRLIAAASRRGLDMGRVVFLDHLDTCVTVLGDLVDVGTLHQTQADFESAASASFAIRALGGATPCNHARAGLFPVRAAGGTSVRSQVVNSRMGRVTTCRRARR